MQKTPKHTVSYRISKEKLRRSFLILGRNGWRNPRDFIEGEVRSKGTTTTQKDTLGTEGEEEKILQVHKGEEKKKNRNSFDTGA